MNMIEKNGNCSEDLIVEKEKSLGFSLPNDYRDFLKLYNGGIPEKLFFSFKGTKEDSSLVDRLFGFIENEYRNIIEYHRSYKKRIPSNALPIGIDPGGNLILLSVSGPDYGKVYFWDHDWEVEDGQIPDYSNLTLIADSFEEFLNSLKSEDEIE